MRRLIQTQEDAIKSIRGQTGELIEHPTLPIKAVLNINTPKSVTLALWQGAGGRPLHYYLYRSEEQARTDLALFWARAEQLLMSKAARKAARASAKASDYWQVGDVAYASWGYEQTNIDFYQVVAVKNRSVQVRELKQKASYDAQSMTGMCQPDRFNFASEEVLTRIMQGDGGFRIDSVRKHVSKWTGTALRYSTYA